MLEMVDPTIITINDICGSLNANSIDSQLVKKPNSDGFFTLSFGESQVIYSILCHTYEIKEKKNQVCGNILYLLVCFLSNSSGWSAEVPDVG